MKYIILLYLLTGCATTEVVLPVQEATPDVIETPLEVPAVVPETKYHVGQCFYLIDHETGKGDTRDILRIDNITIDKYIYRWWIPWTNSWALDTSDGIGKFELFERMVKDSTCPE